LVDEVHVPRRSAKLAVRRALESEVFLQRHGVTNRGVFHFAQRVGVNCAVGEFLASPQKIRGPQETSDMIGTEWGTGSLGHVENCIGSRDVNAERAFPRTVVP
jgi:hypothetical protein